MIVLDKQSTKLISIGAFMKIIICMILFGVTAVCYADQKAFSEKGEEVILHDNGTWEKKERDSKADEPIKVNNVKFKKDAEASSVIKSSVNNTSVFIDAKKWTFTKNEQGESAEFEFTMKDSDLMGMLITERIEVPVENLIQIALKNARAAAPDAVLLEKEYRSVNGKNVIMARINGTVEGIKFAYLGYYYSDNKGTTQLITYTSLQLFPGYRDEAEKFLNGLVSR
jgi:hypothetical protein